LRSYSSTRADRPQKRRKGGRAMFDAWKQRQRQRLENRPERTVFYNIFATMMLTLGADIYTVSKLLGHTKVETTQIYAKIINKKKDDAVSLIDAAFA